MEFPLEIRNKLPEFCRVKSQENQIKDWNFYHNNEHIWNNRSRTSLKVYQFYHKIQDEAQPKFEQMKSLEAQDKQYKEDIRRNKLIMNRLKDRVKSNQKQAIRSEIQNNSNKLFHTSSSQSNLLHQNDNNSNRIYDDISEYLPKKFTTTRNAINDEFRWNKLEEASKKYIDMVITPLIAKNEGAAIINIKKRIENDKSIQLTRKKCFEINDLDLYIILWKYLLF